LHLGVAIVRSYIVGTEEEQNSVGVLPVALNFQGYICSYWNLPTMPAFDKVLSL
jgi:hypothetical protein